MNKERLEFLINEMYYNYLEQNEAKELIDYITDLEQENKELKERYYLIQGGRGNCKTLVLMLQKENEKYKCVLDEIREYITSYSSIHTIQFGTEEDSLNDIEANKMLDEKTITEMTHRYLKVHDKLLQILDKGGKDEQ